MTRRFKVRAVLFDLDGTLADTAPDLGGAVNRMRVRRGLDALPLDVLRPVASAGARGMLAAGMDKHPHDGDYDALRAEFLAEYEAALDRDSRLFDGVPMLLEHLQRAGLPWGIVTNKITRFALPVVRALGLQGTGVLIAGDTTPHAKPHPEPLWAACRALGVPPDEAVYVGDDQRDIDAARAAGMPSVAAAYGYLGLERPVADWGADALVDHPLALWPCLELPVVR